MHRILIALAAAITLFPPADTAYSSEKPNVLFIAVDDLNDWIGCMQGHPQARTPNIDRLAARGVLFTNAHCVAPACNPSRAAVFSGQMPKRTGVWSNQSPPLRRLRPNAKVLPVAFADAGYRTLGTGKLLGDRRAFGEFYGVGQRWSPLTKKALRYTDEELPTKGTDNPRHVVTDRQGRSIVLPLNGMPSDRKPDANDGESFDWGPFDVPDSELGDTQITDWAVDKLKKGFDKPFFLGVRYYRPHIPLWAPKRYFDRFSDSPATLPQVKDDDLDDLSPIARKWALEPVTAGSHATVVRHKQWRAAVEAYLACVTYVDNEIGRLLDTLDGTGLNNSTVIVLWSDHGWHLGEKQHWGKWTGWERSTRVPLIIAPPKTLADRFATAGSRCDQPVSLIDLYPTLAELCNVVPPEKLDGQSLVPLLREPDHVTDRGVLTTFDPGNASLRTEHWRYIRYVDGSEELYDLKNDPHEWENLASVSTHNDQKARMRQKLDEHPSSVSGKDLDAAIRMAAFWRASRLGWKEVFRDPCTEDWRKRWTVDGLKATISNSDAGMEFRAGPVRREDASHAVMWTKDSFQGDVRLDYEYTRVDDAVEAVTILYLQATGSGAEGFDSDISRWSAKRKIPSMKMYFNHMHLHHISYAAFGLGNTNEFKDYIRARRYMPESGKGLANTDLKPDHFNTGMFKTGEPHRITVIKKGDDLFMHIRNREKELLCHWKTDALPPIAEGRIGLRHMWTRGALYRDFRVSQLTGRSGEK